MAQRLPSFAAAAAAAACLLAQVEGLAVSAAESQHEQRWKTYHDPCQCFGWEDVYGLFKVQCGMGTEMYPFTKHGWHWLAAIDTVGKDLCENFYQKLTNLPRFGSCVNVDFTNEPKSWSGGQWCYTSSNCSDLNGGAKVEQKPGIAWKVCKEGKDSLLRNMTPRELIRLSNAYSIDIGWFVKMAYPVFQNVSWTDAGKLWGYTGHSELAIANATATGAPLASDMHVQLAKVVNSSRPMIFDMRSDGDVPFVLTEGSKWGVIRRVPHSKSRTELVCAGGCKKPPAGAEKRSK